MLANAIPRSVHRNSPVASLRKVPVDVTIAAYRSTETRRLSRQLGFDVAVISAVEDAAAHARVLSRRWHGAIRVREGLPMPWDTCVTTPSATDYELFAMDRRWMGGEDLPPGMSVSGGVLRVELAPGAHPGDFGVAFQAAMQDLTFEHEARRPGRVAYRHRTGRRLEFGPRYAADPDPWRRPMVVDDLYAFRPRSMRALVGRAHEAVTLVGVRSALRVASSARTARHA